MMSKELKERLQKTLDAITDSYINHGVSKEEFLRDCEKIYDANVWIRSGI